MIQKNIFSSFEGNKWYERNKEHKGLDRVDVQLGKKYAAQKRGGKILEIGAAAGEKLNQYSTLGLECYGMDPAAEAIKEGSNKHPHLKLSKGTADQLSFIDSYFDIIIFGFCLYLVDRSLLMRAICEADRVLKDQGFLIITDFDPLYPCKKPYHHLPEENVFSYKMAYEKLYLAYPHYSLVEKVSYSHAADDFSIDTQERISTVALYKSLEQGYIDVK